VQITGKVDDEFLLKFFEGRNVSPGQTNFSADLDAELLNEYLPLQGRSFVNI